MEKKEAEAGECWVAEQMAGRGQQDMQPEGSIKPSLKRQQANISISMVNKTEREEARYKRKKKQGDRD